MRRLALLVLLAAPALLMVGVAARLVIWLLDDAYAHTQAAPLWLSTVGLVSIIGSLALQALPGWKHEEQADGALWRRSFARRLSEAMMLFGVLLMAERLIAAAPYWLESRDWPRLAGLTLPVLAMIAGLGAALVRLVRPQAVLAVSPAGLALGGRTRRPIPWSAVERVEVDHDRPTAGTSIFLKADADLSMLRWPRIEGRRIRLIRSQQGANGAALAPAIHRANPTVVILMPPGVPARFEALGQSGRAT